MLAGMRWALICVATACGPSSPPPSQPVTLYGQPEVLTPGIVDTDAGSYHTVEYHCLPVLAKPCSCVYSCGLGRRDEDDRWIVTHSHWKTPLTAVLDKWCVGGDCKQVFSAQIICDGTCAPKPAPTCLAIDLANEKDPCPTAP